MMMIPDDPMIRSAERTGYGPNTKYQEAEDPHWESPDGELVSRDNFADFVRQMALDDPHWVADCLGFVWKDGGRWY